ncbi:TPA: hypothetical protein DEP96_02630 [Candidatus Uhrbacteria bacterium]|nr:hypothetical protein [Candidatus Uhrbacteria bacterium]
MSQIEKLIEAIKRAKVDVRFVDLEQLLVHCGYINVRQAGSHIHFRKEGSSFVTIPVHNHKVRIVYVKEILKLLDI